MKRSFETPAIRSLIVVGSVGVASGVELRALELFHEHIFVDASMFGYDNKLAGQKPWTDVRRSLGPGGVKSANQS